MRAWGGSSSTLAWNLRFDPVAFIAAAAAGCPYFTFVDDLLAAVRGPGHTLLMYLALLAATKRVGLVVADHTCVQVAISDPGPAIQEALAPFPLDLVTLHDNRLCLSKGPTRLYADLLLKAGLVSERQLTVFTTPCKCKAKHAVVPATHVAGWADALATQQ